ncbi:hypothetical protein Sjap_010919 [Stephania japonica]|uniref:F-box domain-containing protein n=1 Tax=Stephania japonica TaxID=461633 RepID=A0AAP0P462_9MAGN
MDCKPHAPHLPDDVLRCIVDRLGSLVCFAAFRSVCKSWRSFFLQHYRYLVLPPPPWIMLPNPDLANSTTSPSVYNLYGFEEQKLCYQCKIPDNCTEFIGSSGTWLVYKDNEGDKLRVWNPLSLIEISLPLLMKNGEVDSSIAYDKVVVSCTGPLIKNVEDVQIGLIYNKGSKLACIRLGDKEWTTIGSDSFPTTSIEHNITDLVFYNGKFYFVDQFGAVYVCDENVHVPCDRDYHYCVPRIAMKLIDSRFTSYDCVIVYMFYLVEVEGELMLVMQFHKEKWQYLDKRFKVFKLDLDRRGKEYFVHEHHLKGYSLFFNNCYGSMAVRTVSGRSRIYVKTNVPDATSEIRNHQMVEFNYMKRYGSVFSEVTKLHCHSTHPVWIIPKSTNELIKTKSSTGFLGLTGVAFLFCAYNYIISLVHN